MRTKLSIVVENARSGNWAKALSVVSKFPCGFSTDERRAIQIASESLNGHASFYASLGLDCESFIEKAKNIVTKKYKI